MAAARTSGARKNTFAVDVTLVNRGKAYDLGVWDTKTGGDVDSNDTTYRPGALGPQITLGGQKTTSNITVTRLYDRNADGAIVAVLLDAVGKGQLGVTQSAIDDDGNSFSPHVVWIGKLKRVLLPDVDSNSDDAAMIELEMSIAGVPTAQ